MKLKQRIKMCWLMLFRRTLSSDFIQAWFKRSFVDTSRSRDIKNYSNPYLVVKNKKLQSSKKIVIITGRFRSGSTLLWNIFRQFEGFTAYYEPFNERRWFDNCHRGSYTDETHRGVTDYWQEYKGLDILASHYKEDWTRWRLFMSEKDFDLDMTRFLNLLVGHSPRTPVLQFNRVDFRLGWLRHEFPEASMVHIYRNPRDQWCSTLRSDKSYTKNSHGGETFNDRFYLEAWVRDLSQQFPFLANYDDKHRYYQFYFLWKLSYCYGKYYSDVSISLEELTRDPTGQINRILNAIDSSWISEEIDLSFIERPQSVWQSYAEEAWFLEIETECEGVLEEFLSGNDIL